MLADRPVPAEIYLNVAVSGLLTGLVYGLMALGLSVIFGVVRVVNFAHGEMMTIAMYLAIALFAAYKLDPLVMLVPIAGVLFALGYVMQRGLINPFINRPEHSQFMLLVAIALIMVNALLIVFGPDAQSVQTPYAFDSFQLGPPDRRRHQGLRRPSPRWWWRRRCSPSSASRWPARRSAPAPTTMPARWWSGSTSSASTR